MTELTARKLLLDLATARPHTHYSIAALCKAGEIVGLSAPSVRMAATRLYDEGILERDGRGTYTLHPSGLRTYPHVEHWATRPATRVGWTGTWAAIDNSTTARTDRTVLRHHDRALELLGFRSWRGALHVRPDNLAGGIPALRRTLQATGMAPSATIFGVHDLDPADDTALRGLWDTDTLTTRLDRTAAELAASRDRLPTLTPEEFAHESLLLGGQAIATILHDPLLPDDLCDPDPLQRLTTLTQAYQDTAQAIWAQLLEIPSDQP